MWIALRISLLLLLWVCPPCLAQKPPTSEGEAAIRGSVEKAATFWNAGDATGLARMWAEDGDLIDVTANQTKGRAAIEKRFAEALRGPFKGSLMTLHVNAVRFLSSGVAVIDGNFEISGGHRADGSELFPEKGLFTDVVMKKSGKWAVACHREMVPISSGISTIH